MIKRWRWVPLALTALAAQLIWAVALGPREPRFDERHYILHARNLAAGKGYVDESGRPAAFWPAGYPALLSACYRVFGDSAHTGIGLQMALGMGAVVLTWLMAAAAFGDRVGRFAGLALAVYPTHVFYTTLNLTEPLFTLLVLLAILLLWRSLTGGATAIAAAGVAIGLAAYVRPVILLFWAVLPFWYRRQMWPFAKALTGAALAGGCALMVMAPWLARTHALTGRWEISTEGGYNLWVGNYPGAFGGYAFPTEILEPMRNGDGYDFSRGYGLGMAAIAAAPGHAVVRAVQKVSYFFALETDGAMWNFKGLAHPPPAIASTLLLAVANAAYLWVLGFALLGLMGSASHPLASLLVALTAYLVAVTAVFIGDPRYHYALIPLAAIFAARGWLEERPALWQALRANEAGARRKLLAWGVTMGVFGVLMAANLALKFLEGRARLSSG